MFSLSRPQSGEHLFRHDRAGSAEKGLKRAHLEPGPVLERLVLLLYPVERVASEAGPHKRVLQSG
jgi:hypothetical protein